MSDITFNPGVIYVGSPGGEMHPLGECKEEELYEAVLDKDAIRINDILTSHEATFTLTLTQGMVNALIEQILNMRELVIDQARDEGHSRIAHLARHARKHRTRKKNIFRSYRILERMCGLEHL